MDPSIAAAAAAGDLSAQVALYQFRIAFANAVIKSAVPYIAAFGFFVGDWSYSIFAELEMLLAPFRTITFAYFAVRISTLSAFVLYLLQLFAGDHPAINCAAVFKSIAALAMISAAGSYSILALRAQALLMGRKGLTITVWTACILTTFSHIIFLATYTSQQPDVGGVTACPVTPTYERLSSLVYFMAFFYDLGMSCLMLWLLHGDGGSIGGSHRPVRDSLLQSTASYFAVMVLTSLSCAMLLAIPPDGYPSFVRDQLIPIHTVLTSTMACRIVRSLRAASAHDKVLRGTATLSSNNTLPHRSYPLALQTSRDRSKTPDEEARTSPYNRTPGMDDAQCDTPPSRPVLPVPSTIPARNVMSAFARENRQTATNGTNASAMEVLRTFGTVEEEEMRDRVDRTWDYPEAGLRISRSSYHSQSGSPLAQDDGDQTEEMR
ncbi:hypothetical protein IE81DRAFT_320356 [Ceraceosorus guamensis]|uniref:Uncharacterized protein n=1 Tax=Ceraceosorus guamensis TaxID=1522189 RepID=A0A316W6C6_9BASI|nr:hypothetical protein IE81DRAFT_320356 [Ceraceosorus guamensis]PWN45184.1 hypothetical protein IE81DRAFT_320356 [Ceraceosorus guamensis]